jgi:integrase
LTVADYLTEWLSHVRSYVRPSTYNGYESNTRLHLIPRIGKKKLARLAVRDVRLMVDAMRTDGMNPRSICTPTRHCAPHTNTAVAKRSSPATSPG